MHDCGGKNAFLGGEEGQNNYLFLWLHACMPAVRQAWMGGGMHVCMHLHACTNVCRQATMHTWRQAGREAFRHASPCMHACIAGQLQSLLLLSSIPEDNAFMFSHSHGLMLREYLYSLSKSHLLSFSAHLPCLPCLFMSSLVSGVLSKSIYH